MAEEVLPGIFRIELPLPRNPLRSINSYVVIGESGNLVVDTGMNRPECRDVLGPELDSLGIDLSETDVFVTHLHADHLGLAPFVSRGKTNVFMGKPDIDMLAESDYWGKMHSFAVLNGFPDRDPQEAIKKHPGYKYGPLGKMNMNALTGGEKFDIGRYHFEVIPTPGHSHGHMCLYDRENRILFSGDHILGDITPNISLWWEGEDHLTDYIGSLKKIRSLEVDLTLPGHRSVIRDHRKRIDELIRHHLDRASEVLKILEDGDMNAFVIASRMSWDLTIRSFDDFPIMQKWFATGEALAHIKFLENQKKVKRISRNGEFEYQLI